VEDSLRRSRHTDRGDEEQELAPERLDEEEDEYRGGDDLHVVLA
jgi:hypothetical protein